MRYLLLTITLVLAPVAMANSELNGDDVTSNPPDVFRAPDPSARSVVIHFNKDGVPLAVAHSEHDRVRTADLNKLAFAQVVAAAEEPNNLQASTPATEKNDAQGTPQWGFAGRGFGGAVFRGPNGGVIAAGRGFGGVGWGGGWNGGWGGWNGGWGGWSSGWNSNWNGCGWGGCGCRGCQTPVYYYGGCAYGPVGFYGGGFGGGGYGGDDFYGIYEPGYY